MNPSSKPASPIRTLVFGGVLPVVIFTVIETYYGTQWGLVAGVTFGIGEIFYEWFTKHKVETFTWIGNGMILGLGGISLFTQEGIWFKLQPAILELAMSLFIIGSSFVGRPLLVTMAEKQGMFERLPQATRPLFRSAFRHLSLRVGIFFLAHAALATWAAFSWTTTQWALLKGVGFTGSFILYLLTEVLLLRRSIAIQIKK